MSKKSLFVPIVAICPVGNTQGSWCEIRMCVYIPPC